jgi:hypothetical protein
MLINYMFGFTNRNNRYSFWEEFFNNKTKSPKSVIIIFMKIAFTNTNSEGTYFLRRP